MRMSLILGVSWILESVHHFLHPTHENSDVCTSATEIFFRLVDVFNLSRGVCIFIIFVCKRTVLEKLKKSKYFRRYETQVEFRQRRRVQPGKGSAVVSGQIRSGQSANFTVLSKTEF